ncbi:MAG: hypothetical protein FIA96_08755 [Betaproteobacteria bacterium]|nr:hypothetical protein [Betaproteobacteria bacterium]
MKWLLVAIVMNTPVKTDLIFNNLADCLAAEQQMRKEWTEVYNAAKKAGAEPERIGQISSQMTKGTCIPAK